MTTIFELGVFLIANMIFRFGNERWNVDYSTKVSKAINGNFLVISTEDEKSENDELTYTSTILHLSNAILKKIGKHDSMQKLREKLENLYLLKSKAKLFFLLERFFRLKNWLLQRFGWQSKCL